MFLQNDSHLDQNISLLTAYDWPGLFLSLASLGPLLYAVTTGGAIHAWTSVTILSLLVLGLVGLAAFLIYEGLFAKKPMVPLRIFRNITAISGFLSAWIQAVLIWAVGYYLVLYVRLTITNS
jgi:hypothetical protein